MNRGIRFQAFFTKRFPTFRSRNVALYYALTMFMNGWFILPNWVFYFSRFINIPQIGVIDGLSKLVAVILEVPSGAVSDLFGKRNTLIFGNVSIVASCIVLMFASNFPLLLLGNILMFIGFAFISGSKEAILYDSMIDIKKERHYDEVLGKVNSIATCVTIFSIFAGGVLYGIHPKLTFFAWMMFSMIATTLLFFMKEPKSDSEHVSYAAYISKLKTGVTSIFKQPAFTFILPVLFFPMLVHSYEGVIRQNTGAYFGFNGETFGYLLALIFIPTLFVSYNYKKIVDICKDHIEHVFMILYAIGFFLVYIFRSMSVGVVSFLFIYIAQELVKPYVVSLVNKNTQSKHRATALSTVSLFSEFPYIVLVMFGGSLIQVDKIKYLYVLLCVALLVYAMVRGLGAGVKIEKKRK